MTPKNDNEPDMPNAREEEDPSSSSIQIQLAAKIIRRLIERNADRDVAGRFWDDNALDSPDDGDDYRDPELGYPDEETLPEEHEINWNIFECD